MMKFLVTGFEPFLGEEINPSQLLALELTQMSLHQPNGLEVQSLILPVEYEKSFSILEQELLKQNYDFILMLGQAAGRDSICLEKVALNLADAAHADSAGVLRRDQKIFESEEEAYFSSLPLRQMSQSLSLQGHRVRVSTTAGTYVCNDLYYRCFLWQEQQKTTTDILFVHVPYELSQVAEKPGVFAMSFDEMQKTLQALICELAQCRA